MDAIRVHEYGRPEVMRLETVPDLSAGPGQIVIEVRAAGVNPVDTYLRSGQYHPAKALPYTPGMDAAGTVVQIGPDVEGFETGDRVFVCGSLSGTYARQALCLPSQVYPLPEEADFAQGAALGIPYGTAWRALFGRACAAAGNPTQHCAEGFRALFGRACAAAGQTVLVHGASGGVGIAAVQLAAAAGLSVIATAGTEKGRRLAAEQGARWTLDHHDAHHFEAVRDLTEGRGVDIILEMLANENLDRDLEILALGGCAVVIGSRGRIEIDPRKTMARDLNICGMMLTNVPETGRASIYARICDGLKTGRLKPVIGLALPLDQAATAHHEVMESAHCGKIVLIP